jgi:lipopolysaccharide assembly outer membrane protein LptD (OstA)
MIATPGGRPATAEEISSADASCWGEKSFPMPSDNIRFEVNLFGLANDTNACSRRDKKGRQSATYNLLSLEADNVTYHSNDRVLEAKGNVAIENESGHQKAESVKFRIIDGSPQRIR